MKTETLKRIIRVLENTASKDETRYHLCCVELTDKTLVATDGHILTKLNIDDDFLQGLEKTYIYRDMLPYLKMVLNNSKRLPIVQSKTTKNSIELENKLITVSEVRYPNWKQIVPTFEPTFEVGFDADLILKLAKSLTDGKKYILKFSFKDKNSPCVVTTKDLEKSELGIIMPVKV